MRNVLFLCTGNSACSIIAEAILRRLGEGTFGSYSAGSMPKGQIHPRSAQLLTTMGFDPTTFRSKNWDEFAAPGAPRLDYIFTVCDNAAGEVCPIWPGQPINAHWGVPDPAAAEGTDAEIAAAFAETWRQMNARISAFVALPFDTLDPASLKARLAAIGRGDAT